MANNIEDSMLALNYSLYPNGACQGLTDMALSAFLAKEIDILKKRLHFIAHTSKDQIKTILRKIQDDQTIRHKKIKLQLQTRLIKKWTLILDEKQSFEKQLNSAQQKIYYQQLSDAYAIADREFEKHNKDAAIISSIPAFFNGVLLYENPIHLTYLANKNEAELYQLNDTPFTLLRPLALENNLQKKLSDYMIDSWFNIYSSSELEIYYSKLASLLKKNGVTQEVAFTLCCYDHIFLMIYDPNKTPPWSIIENNALLISSSEKTLNEKSLAHLIYRLCNVSRINEEKDNKFIILATKVYTNEPATPALNKALKEFHEWELQLKTPDLEEAMVKDLTGSYLIHTAIKMHDNIKTKVLLDTMLNKGLDINKKHLGNTLLNFAISCHNSEAALFLLKANAKHSLSDLLSAVTLLKNSDVLKILLKTDSYDKIIYSPFLFACKAGATKAVKYMIQQYSSILSELIDYPLKNIKFIKYICIPEQVSLLNSFINKNKSSKSSIKITPLFLAALNGHTEIVDLLLQAGASPYSDSKSISPYEIATFIGYKEISTLLLPYEPLQHLNQNIYNKEVINKLRQSVNHPKFTTTLQHYQKLDRLSSEILKNTDHYLTLTFFNQKRKKAVLDLHHHIKNAFLCFKNANNKAEELESITFLIEKVKTVITENDDIYYNRPYIRFFTNGSIAAHLKAVLEKNGGDYVRTQPHKSSLNIVL